MCCYFYNCIVNCTKTNTILNRNSYLWRKVSMFIFVSIGLCGAGLNGWFFISLYFAASLPPPPIEPTLIIRFIDLSPKVIVVHILFIRIFKYFVFTMLTPVLECTRIENAVFVGYVIRMNKKINLGLSVTFILKLLKSFCFISAISSNFKSMHKFFS